MEKRTNLQFSAEELSLVNNTEWILTKHSIIKKVYDMFGDVCEIMKQQLSFHKDFFAESLYNRSGKISRGDNYQMLPYVILDYPSLFLKNNIFAIRTMFWWGNFFSVTLHLSGEQKRKYIDDNSAWLFNFLKENDFSICVNTEEWQHHFEQDNYVSSSALSALEYQRIIEKSFFKAAKKLPLKESDKAYNFIIQNFTKLIESLQLNSRDDKKDLLPGFPTTGSGL